MFDGINLAYNDYGKTSHIQRLDIWEILVNEKTGKKVNDCKTASIQGLNLTLKPSTKAGNNLTVKGSLHKFYNNGLSNSDQFTLSKLEASITKLEKAIGIKADQLELHGLEIGVNIELPIKASTVIKNAVCYKGNPFTFINKKEPLKGIVCSLNDYELKIYDKGLQSETGQKNLLRVEIKVNKMRYLSDLGLKYLTDLIDIRKSYSAKNVLHEAINNVIWTNTKIDISKMSNREQKQFLYYSNPKTWQNINKHKAYRSRVNFKNLLNKYSSIDFFRVLKDAIQTAWEGLFEAKKEAQNPRPFHRVESQKEAQKTATFSPFIWTVKKSQKQYSKSTLENLTFQRAEMYQVLKTEVDESEQSKKAEKRKCISCGNDISKQRKQSKFCSEKYTTKKQAKQCRNKESNRIRGIKAQINKALKLDSFITVSYQDENGITYSDKLHPSEMTRPPNQWLRRITEILIHLKQQQNE
jgi:hypothetical protein